MSKITQIIKHGLLVLIVSIAALQLNAQNTERCGTMEHHQWKMQHDPAYAKSFLNTEKVIKDWINNHPNYKTSSAVADTIPIVVHIVYKTAAENISDAQINSQIDVLNEDFSRTNADSVNTPAIWQSISGVMPYHFILARQDPNGNPTNGIVRVSTTTTTFSTNDAIKFDSQGGSDAWDVTTYLNIWVGNLGTSLLGYGEFPTGTPSNTYGFVCMYSAFGRIGTVNAPYDLGRTTTHEISHCFNLFHIWGDDGNACTGDDQVADTPNQGGATTSCLTFPATDGCSPSAPGIMFMNYMDYSFDNCLNMFTQGQATRMISAINSFYPTIVNSIGIQPVVLQVNDAGIPAIVAPVGGSCNTTITPIVSIKNWGTATLTSATINYRIDANAVQTYNWTGNLASLATASVTLPNITSIVGSHFFTAYTTLPNGTADGNITNDTATSAFSILSGGQAIPFTESFTSATFPPVGWSVNNNDGGTTWDRATVSQGGGTGSLWMDNFNYNAYGELDEMISPNFDLTSVTNPQMTFYLSYQLYTDPSLSPNYSDTLEVLISTDCGVTYSSLYKKFGVPLTTTVATWANNSFTPTAANQWRQETISLATFASNTTAIFKFRNINQYENNLYIDNINLNTATGINNPELNNLFSVYPSPSKGTLVININNLEVKIAEINLYDMLGNLVYNKLQQATAATSQVIDISHLSDGIYVLQLNTNQGIVNRKVTLSKF